VINVWATPLISISSSSPTSFHDRPHTAGLNGSNQLERPFVTESDRLERPFLVAGLTTNVSFAPEAEGT
jgi:hypothetical protein